MNCYGRLGYAEDAVQHFGLLVKIATINDLRQVKALKTCLSSYADQF